MNNNLPSNLVQNFEQTFHSCIGLLANSNCQQINETEESKLNIEQCIQKYLDNGRQLEAFFLQKRFLFITQKPDQTLIEDLNDVKAEILRKDQLLIRLNDKINHWKNILSDNPIPIQSQNSSILNINIPVQINQNTKLQQRSPIQQIIQQPIQHNIRQNIMPNTNQQSHNYVQYAMPNQQMINIQPQHSEASLINNQIHSIAGNFNTNMSLNSQQQQSHLAFLEKTTSSIGIDNRR